MLVMDLEGQYAISTEPNFMYLKIFEFIPAGVQELTVMIYTYTHSMQYGHM